jgi:hypothetical protein
VSADTGTHPTGAALMCSQAVIAIAKNPVVPLHAGADATVAGHTGRCTITIINNNNK